jgi:uncharacterized RDD family membrane protein YckC
MVQKFIWGGADPALLIYLLWWFPLPLAFAVFIDALLNELKKKPHQPARSLMEFFIVLGITFLSLVVYFFSAAFS